MDLRRNRIFGGVRIRNHDRRSRDPLGECVSAAALGCIGISTGSTYFAKSAVCHRQDVCVTFLPMRALRAGRLRRKVLSTDCTDFRTDIFPPSSLTRPCAARRLLLRWEENWVLKSVKSVDELLSGERGISREGRVDRCVLWSPGW
jgi:hypothetical protein